MGRSPCCEKEQNNKGAWTKEEDQRLINYINLHGQGCWRSLPAAAGLLRCGKSCRLRWINYLRPDLRRGNFTNQEDDLIINLHTLLGNKWSLIAARLPGRTDNEIKNYWNTHVRRKLYNRGIDPLTHRPLAGTTVAPTKGTTTTTTGTHGNKTTGFQLIEPTQSRPSRELTMFMGENSNSDDVGSDSSTTGVTTEDGELNLQLSIGLPMTSLSSSSSSSGESKTLCYSDPSVGFGNGRNSGGNNYGSVISCKQLDREERVTLAAAATTVLRFCNDA